MLNIVISTQTFVLLFLYIFIFIFNFKKTSKLNLFLFTSFYIYLFYVLHLTLLPIDFTPNPMLSSENFDFLKFTNFTPFIDIIIRKDGALTDIVLNIIMTIPFGFFMPLLFKFKKLQTIFSAFLFSLFIECSQLLITIFFLNARICDVTDVISNTFGGFLGVNMFFALSRLYIRLSFRRNLKIISKKNK